MGRFRMMSWRVSWPHLPAALTAQAYTPAPSNRSSPRWSSVGMAMQADAGCDSTAAQAESGFLAPTVIRFRIRGRQEGKRSSSCWLLPSSFALVVQLTQVGKDRMSMRNIYEPRVVEFRVLVTEFPVLNG